MSYRGIGACAGHSSLVPWPLVCAMLERQPFSCCLLLFGFSTHCFLPSIHLDLLQHLLDSFLAIMLGFFPLSTSQSDGMGKVACLVCSFSKQSLWRLKRLPGKYGILAQFSLSRHISFQKIISYQHNHVIAIFQAFSFCACAFYIWVKSHPPQAIGTKLSWELNVPNKRKLQRES